MSLGETIANLRKERGWNQTQLAKALGMTPSHVSRWEKNHVHPRRRALEKLAEVLGVTLQELLESRSHSPEVLLETDPEIGEIVTQISLLNDEQRSALRLVLRSMVTCQQLQSLAARS